MNPGARRLAVYLAVAAAAGGGYWIYRAFLAPTPVERIGRLLERGRRAAEAESVIRLGDVFTMDYHDDSGVDRATMLGEAQQFFRETDQLSVRIARVMHEDEALGPEANQARAIVVLQVSGLAQPGAEKFSGIGGKGVDAFLVRFEKRNGDWKVAATRRLSATTPEELEAELRRANQQ